MSSNVKGRKTPAKKMPKTGSRKASRKASKQPPRAAQRQRDRSLAIPLPRRRPPQQRLAGFTAATQTPASTPRSGVVVRLAQLPHAAGLPLPAYQTPGAAGLDLIAAVPGKKPMKLAPRARVLVPTGLVMELPAGWEAQVRPRSGLASKHGVTVLNSPGTIDSDYRGEIQVILVNLSTKAFRIERGERIAQMVIASAPQARITAVAATKLSATARGAGGFGSTGTRSRTAAKLASKKRANKSKRRGLGARAN